MHRGVDPTELALEGRKALVTGAGGFIGSHLTERLLALGCQVRAVHRYNSRADRGHLSKLDHPNLETAFGDIRDPDFVRSAVKGCQDIYHLAALIGIPYSYEAPQSYIEVNVSGTGLLLGAARDSKVERFIQTSTSEVYGSAQYEPMDEKHPLRPQSPYAATKVGADQLALSYHLAFGLPVTLVRPFNTYGPRQSLRAIVPTLCAQALGGNQVRLGNLETFRDLTHVEDTCAGFIHAAATSQAVGQTINLGFGKGYSIRELVEQVAAILGKPLEVVEEEHRKRPKESEVNRLLSDNRSAREMLGWTPRIDLETGLRDTLAWISGNAYSSKSESYVV